MSKPNIPSLFVVVPVDKDTLAHPKAYLGRPILVKCYLYFCCAHTRRRVDAPIKLNVTKEWINKFVPGLAGDDNLNQANELATLPAQDIGSALYDYLCDVAADQDSWRGQMEPVHTATDPTIVWVSKEVANHTSLGYIRQS